MYKRRHRPCYLIATMHSKLLHNTIITTNSVHMSCICDSVGQKPTDSARTCRTTAAQGSVPVTALIQSQYFYLSNHRATITNHDVYNVPLLSL